MGAVPSDAAFKTVCAADEGGGMEQDMLKNMRKHLGSWAKPRAEKALTIIIPLYNALPYFERTVESILNQTLRKQAFEVIVVDDGSTDGSGTYADEVARSNPALFRVIHIDPSGGPARPRNIGIAAARGEYVFFLDADDFLGKDALKRMLKHARDWDSDILVPKQVGENGRVVPTTMFRMNQPKADVWVSRVFYTLSPLKLFKRSLLLDNSISFPEELRYREDEVFTSKALFCAGRVSVASDYDYCHIVEREDGGNLSSEPQVDFQKSFQITQMMLNQMDEYLPSRELGDQIVLPRILRSVWFASAYAASKQEAPARDQMFEQLGELISGRIGSDELTTRLPNALNVLASCIVSKDYERAAKCFELIRVSASGSYETLNKDAGTLSFEDGKAMLRTADGAVAIDATETIPLEDRIENASLAHDLIFQCSCVSNEAWDEHAEFVLHGRQKDGDEAFETHGFDVSERSDGRVAFTLKLDEEHWGKILSIPGSAWDMYLEAQGNGLRREGRFGGRMPEELRRAFPEGKALWQKGDQSVLVHYTPAGNLVLRAR